MRPLRPGETPGQLSGHLKAQALDAGLTKMRRPERTPNTLKPLQAAAYAQEHAKGDAVRDALYVAYWDEGRDIGTAQVIREVIEAAGLEWGPLEAALAADAYLPVVLGEYQEAADLGFEGIPAFAFGNLAFTGAQPMQVFRAVAQRAREALAADPEAFSRWRKAL